MQIIQRMNKKLDLGWKLTNSNCEKCDGVTLADPSNVSQYYCPKCDKILIFKQSEEQEIQNQNQPSPTYHENKQQDEDYFNEVLASSGMFSKKGPQAQTTPKTNAPQQKQSFNEYSYQRKQQSSKDVSKKLGQKLLQGWTMLEQSCIDCNVPLMKSRRGEKLCLSCNKDYAAIQAEKQNKVKTEQPKIAPSMQVPAQLKYPSGESKLPQSTTLPSQQQQQQPASTLSAKSPSSQNQASLIEVIECKALRFLQFKMDKAIDENDIGAVEKILSIIQSLKKL